MTKILINRGLHPFLFQRSKKKQMGVKPVVRREPHLQSVSQDRQQSSELLWKVSFCALEDENQGTGVFHKVHTPED